MCLWKALSVSQYNERPWFRQVKCVCALPIGFLAIKDTGYNMSIVSPFGLSLGQEAARLPLLPILRDGG